MAENGITPLEHEVVIYSQLGYAGKLDLYATMGDKKILVDFKTGSLHKEKNCLATIALQKRAGGKRGSLLMKSTPSIFREARKGGWCG